jgi:hypothetical protein
MWRVDYDLYNTNILHQIVSIQCLYQTCREGVTKKCFLVSQLLDLIMDVLNVRHGNKNMRELPLISATFMSQLSDQALHQHETKRVNTLH